MIETLKDTQLYKSLNLMKDTHHAYLFHSLDKSLNNEVALTFAKSLMCSNSNCCNECFNCIQFNKNSHPDFILVDQSSIKVDDVNGIIGKLSTMPISSDFKIFLILNAENINEIAQNKLLKSLEEPNPKNIFILTSSKIDKLLPTVLSRLHKISIPKLSDDDKSVIKNELTFKGVNLDKYINSNLSLTDIINFETDENHKKTIDAIKYIFENLKSSQDIPKVANTIPEFDKTLFLKILQMLFLSCANNENIFEDSLTALIKSTFSQKALLQCLPLIEDAYKKQMANVNFSYILDNLLFNILKEKFLCNQ
ncbi:MAG: hypothetical protein IJ415_03440 [Clostridia bacterium]|nr:hypothetical protein [Clostridia bacterium]